MYLSGDSEKSKLGLSKKDLAEKCEVEEEEVGKKMTFWIARGVVRERRDSTVDGIGASNSYSSNINSNNSSSDVNQEESNIFYEVIEDQAHLALSDLEETPVCGATGSLGDAEDMLVSIHS